ncbi:MAG: serine hydrolase [Candidatus Binatia bacterium]|nr:MAG: serine hydrolase [Candidatus Binatia bacterium]
MEIFGYCDPRFERVRDAFRHNFASRGELGAAVHVIVQGKPVVDLWGGIADHHTGTAWKEDTLVLVFSSTKGATAACAHLLRTRGLLDFEAPVARYWPEFAQQGKESLPVSFLLTHQAGLAAIEEPLPPEALFDWSRMTTALARQRPLWRPGEGHGYHAVTFGFLVGEVIRRVSGRSAGHFLREEIAKPLGLEFWIGLPAEYEPRVARVRLPPLRTRPTPFFRALMQRGSLTWQAFMNPPSFTSGSAANTRAVRAAELPASNGITSARGLAGLYAALIGRVNGAATPLLDPDTRALAERVAVDGPDRVLLVRTRFSHGFMKSVADDPNDSVRFGPNDAAFGHVGAGGSFGMADPVAEVAMGYVMNQLGPGIFLNERGQSLIDAVYECLGA